MAYGKVDAKKLSMQKKVGIITIVKVNNYGAELQAYATQKALQLMGYDAEIIDYLFYKNPGHKATRASKPVFPMPIKKRISEFLYPKISRIKQLIQHNEAVETRKTRYTEFHKLNTRFSKEYRSIEELNGAQMDYDAYIVGSDQVWNPGNYTSLNPYFLKFAPKGKKRLSYASSIGLSSLPESTFVYYREAMGGLDAISVREENAVDLVKQVSGCKAQWVLDPTLLLNSNEWSEVAKEVVLDCDKYVLLYELTPCPYLKTLAMHVAKEKRAKVVRITKDAVAIEQDGSVINVTDAGPAEFLWLFKHAEFVVTNSFHGTAFSILMNKDFYVVTPARKKNNSRQQSILNLFGLTDRLMLENASLPSLEQMTIDFVPVNKILEDQREQSKKFLRINIDGE